MPRHPRRRFAHVTDWVFDLDNTLYPHHSNLFSQIDVKMTAYVSDFLRLPREEARKLQKELYLQYGTTLSGLMTRYGIDPDDFLQKVSASDYCLAGARPGAWRGDQGAAGAESSSSPTAIATMRRRGRAPAWNP